MKRHKLIWSVYPFYFVIIIGALYTVAFIASQKLNKLYLDEIAHTLTTRAYLIENSVIHFNLSNKNNELDSLIQKFGQISKTRFTIVDSSGVVIADSEKDALSMENHKNRPEITIAFADSIGQQIRYSSTLNTDMMYVALPIKRDSIIVGVIRTAMPMRAISVALTTFNREMFISGIIVTILATLLSFLIFSKISKPLKELQEGVLKFSKGQFNTRIPPYKSEELGTLSDSMNDMASQLHNRIGTIIQQRNEREAILSSLAEGVLAINMNEQVVNYNAKVLELLEISNQDITGKSIQEIVRNKELHDFINTILHEKNDTENKFEVKLSSEKYITVYGTLLKNQNDKKIGTVIVFNDITKLKRLDKIRRDFVANVSHELRTPITAIKGSVETLLDGALDDTENALKFSQIIDRHTNRLNSIVEDLLSLAKFENESVLQTMQFTEEKIITILESAILAVEQKLTKKNVTLALNCDKDIIISAHKKQLEQAFINLLDNAIKYSNENSSISIDVSIQENNIITAISDRGCGIASQHHSRLFERFYRVDSARSREMGGTGLGLAIVKHIARVHSGTVNVKSELNNGSTFSICIPKKNVK